MGNFNFSTVDKLPREVADNLGWVPDHARTDETKEAHAQIMAALPEFKIRGAAPRVPVPFGSIASDHVFLWEDYKAVNGGKHFLTLRQLIGSCVGMGGQNGARGVMACDIAFRGEREKFFEVYEPFTYGMSRKCAGISGRGSGSTGSGMAEAAALYGFLPRETPGLTGWSESADTLTWSAEADTQWSDGRRTEQKWLDLAKPYLIGQTAPVRSAADVRTSVQERRGTTIASNWGGKMRPSVKEGVLLNTHSDSWNHQMSVHGWMIHNVLGELYYIWNSWGADTHGTCPTGAPPGGFWVTAKDMDYITGQDDSFSFLGINGLQSRWSFPTI